ncbi:MAG: serine/threonine protein kinase [Verrucomicrobia bacterium]|nr:serine/threonine protein kinase [Verrucomicrobiota bacterium]
MSTHPESHSNPAAEPSLAPAAENLLALKPGAVFGNRFKIRRALGSGDEGGVWLAEDRPLNRTVVLKCLPDAICREAAAVNALKEVTRCSSRLIHPNIARTYEFVEAETIAAVALEYVHGNSLTQLRLERPQQAFDPGDLAAWIRSLRSALEYAHDQMGLVHGGLRPDNLVVDTAGQLKLTGFGLAGAIKGWLARLEPRFREVAPATLPRPSLPLSVSDDVYGVGAILYELLTGAAPFEGGNLATSPGTSGSIPTMTERRTARGISGAPIPAQWEQTVAACLALDPARRPRGIANLAAGLE